MSSIVPPDAPQPASLTARQEAAALALAEGKRIGEAAKAAGVCTKTITRWQQDSASGFTRRVEQLRTEIFSEAVGRLAALSAAAVDRLGKLLKSKSQGIALQAARSILENALKLREALEMRERLELLEARLLPGRKVHAP